MFRARQPWRLLVIPGLYLLSAATAAAPSGADLLRACAHALAGGFGGIEGRMCTWYVTPCDCEAARKPAAPRVCLPETVSTERLARQVIAGLTAQPALQTEDADVAAATVLSPLYPCEAN